MSRDEDQIIEKLILNGGLETVGIDQETGEFLYSFTPKIAKLMPDLYEEHLNDVNDQIMNLWEKGFVDLNLFESDPNITLTEKSLDPDSLMTLSKQERWNLLEIMRLLKLKDWYNVDMPYTIGAKGSYGCSGYPALKEGTNEVMGCHKTRSEAAAQIYAINRSEGNIGKSMHEIKEGDFVMYMGEDDEIMVGRVEYVMTNSGLLGLPGSEYSMEYMENDKPVIVREYEEEDGAWEEKPYVSYHRMSEVIKIESLSVSVDLVVEMGSSESGIPSKADPETMMEMYNTQIGKAKKPNYGEIIQPRRGGSEPSNARLYARIIQEAKDKFDVYPSAVANSWVVQEYKRRGGTYKSEKEITKTIWDGGLLDPKNFTK